MQKVYCLFTLNTIFAKTYLTITLLPFFYDIKQIHREKGGACTITLPRFNLGPRDTACIQATQEQHFTVSLLNVHI